MLTRALTTAQLVRVTRRPESAVEAMLSESQRQGIVERDEYGCWRLTAEADENVGRALRDLEFD